MNSDRLIDMAVEEALSQPDTWRMTLSGLCASLVGIGLARFAYTPILPALIDRGWFSASDAAYLGATNLVGYLVGVISAGRLSRHLPAPAILRCAMLLAALSFFACAVRAGFAWFFFWRLVSGVSGGLAMILAAPTILPHVPRPRHGLVGGTIFMGVGFGIVASGTLVPLLVGYGLVHAWTGLGVMASILAVVGWNGWPQIERPRHVSVGQHHREHASRAIAVVSASYALNAFGLVPHMVFLVAFVARGLGEGLDAGTRYWTLFGLGAIVGPVLFGHIVDRVGPRWTLVMILALEIVFVALPGISANVGMLIASSVIVGACTIGVVPVVLAYTRSILRHHPTEQPRAWRRATTSFALMQAAGAYLLSFVFSRTGGDYQLLFLLGAVAMAIGLLVALSVPREEGKA